MKQFIKDNKKNPFFWSFLVLIIAILFAMPILSKDAGNSGDEDPFQIPQGKNVVNYFKTNGVDTTCLTFKNLKYYGSSPDIIAEYWNQTFNIENISNSRHIINALYGWITILFAGLIAYMIGGWRAAVFTVLLFFFSPRFLGHSFNNTKDSPFAAGMMAGVYFITLFIKQFPKIKIYTVIFLIVSIAFSISVRVGGIILYAYFGLFGIIYLITDYYQSKVQKIKNSKKLNSFGFINKFFKLFIFGASIAIISYFLGLLLWPYALQAPIKNPLEAFKEMSKFSIAIRQLFEGSLLWSDQLPWYYTPKYIFMTIPFGIIVGFLMFITLIWKDKKNYLYYFIIFFTCFFPVFWVIYSKAHVYHGWRHTLFAYPTMVAAAGLGFNLAIEWITKKIDGKSQIWNNYKILVINIVSIVVIILLSWNPIRHIIQNHPYEYVYFSKLTGGINNAYGNYEMDYYYHSTREASEWVIANAKKTDSATSEKIKVTTWHQPSVQYFFRNDTTNFQMRFSRWYERGNSDWDYGIFTITGMMPEEIKNENFPPKNTVFQIKVDGKPICLVLKRETKEDYIGYQQKNKKEFFSAIQHFKNAIEIDSYNISTNINLIESYFNVGYLDSAKFYIDKVLKYVPKYETANYMLAFYFNTINQPDSALRTLKIVRENNTKFSAGYHFAYQIYMQQKDLKNAEKIMLLLMKADQLDEQGINQLISIYKAQGLDERSAYKKFYKKYISVLEKAGKKERAKSYQDALKKMK